MKAELLLRNRSFLSDTTFIELVLWRLPEPARGSMHLFKYRLAYVVEGECALRYDNEAGKGDHRHIGEVESPYMFTTAEQLIQDFLADIKDLR